MGCFSGRLMSAASDQKFFYRLCSPFCCSFDEFVEEKVISPSYSSAILTPPPYYRLLMFVLPWSILWRRQWHPTPVLLPGKSHGQRGLVGCSPWGRWELDTTKRLHFQFSLSCIGEANGNPLQYSCLENPRDGEAWWAAICGVTQSWTWLKRLSSNSSSRSILTIFC